MKALSIQQPWAWLIVNGHKDIENRDWHTWQRGEVYVHAGKRFDKAAYDYIRFHHPDIKLPLPHQFDLGGIVGQVEIYGCCDRSDSKWFFGKHGFQLRNAKPLPFRPYKGQLGFFNITEN